MRVARILSRYSSLMLISLSTLANASTMTDGSVSIQGSIVDSACTIATESSNQFIDMEVISTTQMIRDGHGPIRPFSIYLIDCILSDHASSIKRTNKFQIVFDGARDGNYFRAQGTASGIALQILDTNRQRIIPGKLVSQNPSLIKSMRFDYYLMTVIRPGEIRDGNYYSIIRFGMNYF